MKGLVILRFSNHEKIESFDSCIAFARIYLHDWHRDEPAGIRFDVSAGGDLMVYAAKN
jgi:hypothetical protein